MLRYSLGDAYLSVSTDDIPAPLTMSTVAAGSWTNGATWNAGFSPRNDDVAYVKHSVAASDVELDLATLATLEDAADLQLGSGTDMDVLNGVVINKGIITVGTGAYLSKGSGSEYIHLPRDGNRSSELHVDGGTVYSQKAIFLGAQSNDTGADGTLRVSGGSITSPNQLIFGGGASSVAKMYLTGGTAQFNFINFDQHETQGDVGQTEEIHVDGGDLILTTSDEANAIQFAGDYSKLFFESGAVAIRGVDSQTEFDAYVPLFEGAVDAGYVTSTIHSASTLKSMLYYIGSDAILTDTPADPPALQQTSVASGAWSNGATWDTGIAPRDGDFAWIMDDDVTASGVTVTLGGTLALLNGQQGSLTLSDGSDFEVYGAVPIMDGELSIESGSSLSVYQNGENYIQIGRDPGTTGALTIDGGTYYAERAMFNTLWSSPNSTGTITVANGGSLLSPDWQIIFGGASNTVSKMFINEGGTVECLFIDFDQVDDDPSKNGNGTQYEEVTIDGGDLILTGDDFTNAIEFAGSYSKVFFEGGSITIKGVDTIEDFNNYVPLFEGAVDAQYFDSVTYTDEELKAMLQYSFEGDAVVTEGEVPGYGTMTTSVTGSDSLGITSVALLSGATNVLQFRTDLVTGSWSNLSTHTGSTSNTWEITPLNDPKCFFRIIVE